MTPDKLAKMREIAEKATKGEWNCERLNDDYASDGASFFYEITNQDALVCQIRELDYLNERGKGRRMGAKYDAEHIATFSPSAVLELLDELDRFKSTLERIADPTPSIGRPSFADWELRQMAREALGKK